MRRATARPPPGTGKGAGPPVVPAAVPGARGPATRPAASPPPAGPRLQDRTHGRTRRIVPAGRTRRTATCGQVARGYAGRDSATRGSTTTRTGSHRTGRPVAPAGDQDTGTGPGTAKPPATCTDRSLATCAGRQCRRGPSGVRAASPAADLPAAPLQPAGAAPCHLRRPGSSQNLLSGYPSAQAAPAPAVPRGPTSRAPRGSGPGTASSSVRPPTGRRVCGAVATA